MRGKIVWVLALAASLPAQSIIPAKAGLVSYADEAYIDDEPVAISSSRFFVVNENAVMRTGAGRAEVLLGPCAAMWIDQNSSIRMLSTVLSNVRIELLTGAVIVGTGAWGKGSKVSLLLDTSVASLARKGAYRFDAGPRRVQVWAGKTSVRQANRAVSVTAGRWLSWDTGAGVGKFDTRRPDPLDDWSESRAARLASLASSEKQKVQDQGRPVTPSDLDNVRTAVRGVNHTQTTLSPLPVPPAPGCGVAPW